MAAKRIICFCGAVLSRDEHEHYAYQCSICVGREHELLLAHGRGEEHDGMEVLFEGPVDLGLARARERQRSKKAA